MTLQLSFDALKKEEKIVFLDIACCFKGYTLTTVEQILHAHHGYSIKNHINALVEKSLIKISESGKFHIVTLHDLVEDMGKDIVKQESPNPGGRSRLWASKDINEVLKENKVSYNEMVWFFITLMNVSNILCIIINVVNFRFQIAVNLCIGSVYT
jgi:hypothetical protein